MTEFEGNILKKFFNFSWDRKIGINDIYTTYWKDTDGLLQCQVDIIFDDMIDPREFKKNIRKKEILGDVWFLFRQFLFYQGRTNKIS